VPPPLWGRVHPCARPGTGDNARRVARASGGIEGDRSRFKDSCRPLLGLHKNSADCPSPIAP
jgi:hypothetical protein